MNIKRADEKKLRDSIADNPEKSRRYGKVWGEVEAAYKSYREFYESYYLWETRGIAGSQLYQRAKLLVRLAAEKPKPNAERLRGYVDTALPALESSLYSEAPVYKSIEKQFFEESFLLLERLRGNDAWGSQ